MMRNVAPYVGAWIETETILQNFTKILVAPYVGAWIETPQFGETAYIQTSHPMWVRGLKRGRRCEVIGEGKSHPIWVRGLKRCILSDGSKHFEGVPSWN